MTIRIRRLSIGIAARPYSISLCRPRHTHARAQLPNSTPYYRTGSAGPAKVLSETACVERFSPRSLDPHNGIAPCRFGLPTKPATDCRLPATQPALHCIVVVQAHRHPDARR
jgi:hypothetical protein